MTSFQENVDELKGRFSAKCGSFNLIGWIEIVSPASKPEAEGIGMQRLKLMTHKTKT